MKLIQGLSIMLIVFVLLGCSLSVNVPTVDTTTTRVFEVSEPLPAGTNTTNLEIEMSAGRLVVEPGSSQLVEGTVTYNVALWEPKVTKLANGVLISQEHSTTNVGIPDDQVKNNWDLKLGQKPIDLKISAGAYDGMIDLSGLSITNLEVNDGASKAVVRFDSPNPVEMQRLIYKTGASQVELIGLANANVADVSFESGAGSYTLDFTGELKKDIHVRIASGMSDTKIIVPEGTHVIVELTGGLSSVTPSGTWTINGSSYTAGSGEPTIYVSVEMAVGNLSLVQE